MLLDSASPSSLSAFAFREFTPRAVQSSILLAQVQNAVPFLFDGDFGGIRVDLTDGSPDPRRRYLRDLVAAAETSADRTVAEYFRLSLSGRWASLGSFDPIDGDSLVRFRLWNAALSADEVREMAETALEAYGWDSTAISRRWICSPHSKLILSAHHGEWFTVAVAAYAATRERDPMLSMRLREAIEFEVTRQAKIYLEFRKAGDGAGLLLAATLIADNLNDLDRAIFAWGLGALDPLHEFAYRASYAEGSRASRFGGALAESGRLGKSLGIVENHRHFALRAPRALRRSVELLLPMVPFLDGWGKSVASHPALRREDVAAVIEALHSGWEELKRSSGAAISHAYPRAVAGILAAFPGGLDALAPNLSGSVERSLRSGLFHGLASVSEARFTDQAAARALGFVR